MGYRKEYATYYSINDKKDVYWYEIPSNKWYEALGLNYPEEVLDTDREKRHDPKFIKAYLKKWHEDYLECYRQIKRRPK